MKILTKKSVQLGASDKKTFAKLGKDVDLMNLDKQIADKKSKVQDLDRKIEVIESVVGEKKTELDKLETSIKSFNGIKIKKDYIQVKEKVDLLTIKYDKLKSSFNTLLLQDKESKLSVNSLNIEIKSLDKEVKEVKSKLDKNKATLDNSNKELKKELADISVRKQKASKDCSVIVNDNNKLIEEAREGAKVIVDNAKTMYESIVSGAKEVKNGILSDSEQISEDIKCLRIVLGELVKKNKKEDKKLDSKIAKLDLKEVDVDKKVKDIERIKQSALNDIYKMSQKHKVDKVNNKLKDLL